MTQVVRGWPLVAALVLLGFVAVASIGGAAVPIGSDSPGGALRVGRFDPCVRPAASPSGAGVRSGGPAECRPARQVAPGVGPERYAVVKTTLTALGIAVILAGFATSAVVLVALVGAVGSIRVRRRRETVTTAADDLLGDAAHETAGQLTTAAEAALADLADESDPRRAVIAAWLRLELAASAAGTPRHPAETATELAERVLAAHAVSPATLRRLAELYRVARYSQHEVDERMRVEARRALERLHRELRMAMPA